MDDLGVVRRIVESSPFCTVVTLGRNGRLRARTMSRLNSLDERHLDFPTDLGSAKVEDVRSDPRVTLFFVDPRTRNTASLYGTAEVITEPQVKERCWQEALRHHFPEGHADPVFAVFRVKVTDGEYLIADTEVYGKVRLGP